MTDLEIVTKTVYFVRYIENRLKIRVRLMDFLYTRSVRHKTSTSLIKKSSWHVHHHRPLAYLANVRPKCIGGWICCFLGQSDSVYRNSWWL